MTSQRQILIYTKVEHTARRQIVHGIGTYVRHGHRWQTLIPWADLDHWALPEKMKVDGVIAFPQTQEEIDFLFGLAHPVVCVGPHFQELDLPRVNWDDRLAGELATGHLVEIGLKRIGFVGSGFGENYVHERLTGAEDTAVRHGLAFDALDLEPRGHRPGKEAALARRTANWLKRLEPPFGLIAASDFTAFNLLNTLRSCGIRVPEEAAVVSIGGDNLVCPFSDPALTSVVLPGEQVGYQAAQLLDRLMDRENPAREIRVPPERVAARHSSDLIATSDEMVGRALRFIRDRSTEPIGVGDVLAAVPLSRRPLELRFKHETGRTLMKEIWRVRLERAKEMLIDTDLSVADIAGRCGFSEPQRMTEVFGRELGVAPGVFRQSHRSSRG